MTHLPTAKEMEDAAESYAETCRDYGYSYGDAMDGFKAGVEWVVKQVEDVKPLHKKYSVSNPRVR